MTENLSNIAWYLRISFDRKVAYPDEVLFATATIRNPNPYPIFIGSCYWSFSCYPGHSAGVKEINQIVPAGELIAVPAWRLPIPNVAEGQYQARVSLDTWIWSGALQDWQNAGRIDPEGAEQFFIIHTPRFRAFISRSNRNADRPIVEPIISTIQQWGFDTHTVGINEIENEEGKVPERIISEITKADCVFAIATPRDATSIPALFRTLTWLHNEVSFSYMAEQLTLLIADEQVILDGLVGTKEIPKIEYCSRDLHKFLPRLNNLMPMIRKILLEQSYRRWEQKLIGQIQDIVYNSFIAGMVVQGRPGIGE